MVLINSWRLPVLFLFSWAVALLVCCVETTERSSRWFHRATSNPQIPPRNVTIKRYKTYAVVFSNALLKSSGAATTTSFSASSHAVDWHTMQYPELPQGSLSFLYGFHVPKSKYPRSPLALARFRPQGENFTFEFAAILRRISYTVSSTAGSTGDVVFDLDRGQYHSLIELEANAGGGASVQLTRISHPTMRANFTMASSGTTVRSEDGYVTPQAIYFWTKLYDQDFTAGPLPQSVSLRMLLCSQGFRKIASNPPPHRDPFVGFHYDRVFTKKNKSRHKERWRFHGYVAWSRWLRFRSRGLLIRLDAPVLSKLNRAESRMVKEWNLLGEQATCSAMELQGELPRKLQGQREVSMLWGIAVGLGAVPPLIESWSAALFTIAVALVALAATTAVVFWYGRSFWQKRRLQGGIPPSPMRNGLARQVTEVLQTRLDDLPDLRLRRALPDGNPR